MKQWFAVFLMAAGLNAHAQTTNRFLLVASNTPIPTMTAQLRTEKAGDFAYERAFISTPFTKFAFLVPQNYTLRDAQGNSLTAQHRALNGHLTISLKPLLDCSSTECFQEYCRTELLGEFPTAKITEESTRMVNEHESSVFDLNYYLRGTDPWQVRAVFTRVRGGILEISVTSSKEDFKSTQYDLNTLLLTFRESDAGGKLVIPPLSDRF
jgi:hypothetical protein